MRTGYIISGIGHLVLILWLISGNLSTHVQEAEFVATNVTILSEAEFAALIPPDTRPAPAISEAVVTPAALAEAPAEAPAPQPPAPTPDADAAPERTDAPEIPDMAEPAEAPDVEDLAALPEPDAPAEAPEALIAPAGDTPTLLPELPSDGAPQQADRVAPEPAPLPKPDVEIADTPQPALSPDATRPATGEAQEETAPEAATTEIVTEAEKAEDNAPKTSLRPPARPTRPARPQPPEPQVDPDPAPQVAETGEPAPAPETDPLADVIGAALAEANNQTAEEPRPASGPPLTREKGEGLRVAVQRCWNVDVGSEASNVTVIIGMTMGRDGKLDGPPKLLSGEGGPDRAVKVAFEAARRAILRCQGDGYNLPIGKYDHWREIEIIFRPEDMRTR